MVCKSYYRLLCIFVCSLAVFSEADKPKSSEPPYPGASDTPEIKIPFKPVSRSAKAASVNGELQHQNEVSDNNAAFKINVPQKPATLQDVLKLAGNGSPDPLTPKVQQDGHGLSIPALKSLSLSTKGQQPRQGPPSQPPLPDDRIIHTTTDNADKSSAEVLPPPHLLPPFILSRDTPDRSVPSAILFPPLTHSRFNIQERMAPNPGLPPLQTSRYPYFNDNFGNQPDLNVNHNVNDIGRTAFQNTKDDNSFGSFSKISDGPLRRKEQKPTGNVITSIDGVEFLKQKGVLFQKDIYQTPSVSTSSVKQYGRPMKKTYSQKGEKNYGKKTMNSWYDRRINRLEKINTRKQYSQKQRNTAFTNPPSNFGSMVIPGRNQVTKQVSPYFMTLLEAGSTFMFENQFKRIEMEGPSNRVNNVGPNNDAPQSVADRVMRDLDMTVQPCENFYKFACGGYINKNREPASGFKSSSDKLQERVVKILKEELQLQDIPNNPAPLVKAKRLYRSCMNEGDIEQRAISPVLNFLTDRGGWPVLGTWNKMQFNLIDMMAQTRPLIPDSAFGPSGVIIGINIRRDFKKKGKYAIYLDQPSLGQLNIDGQSNHEIYKLGRNIKYNKAYEEYLIDLAVTLGADPVIARTDMCDVVNFETELAKIMIDEEDRRLVEKRYKKVSIRQLSSEFPRFDWLYFIQSVLSPAGIQVDETSSVILWSQSYFQNLCNLTDNTPKRVLANYILFRAIQPMLPSLSRQIQYLKLRYTAIINGAHAPTLPNRSDFCAKIVSTNMDWVASRLLAENSFDETNLIMVDGIKNYVKLMHHELINHTNWMSDKTKMAVLRKIEAIKTKLAFPGKLFDESFIEKYYKNFTITDNFFENMEITHLQNFIQKLRYLVNPKPNNWIMRPVSTRPLHNAGTVSIEIPAAAIGEPYFNPQYPPSMNFGAIGTMIAQLYAHAYDATGIRFDGKGLITQAWSDASVTAFGDRADCFVTQYSRYDLPEADLYVVNGNKTLDQNIADNAGIKAAFHAYQRWRTDHKVADVVPGLPFNGEQLFFINHAKPFCLSASKTYLRKLPYLDNRSLDPIRVIGALQNLPEFSAVFQCPLGSMMNPVSKCSMW